MGFDYVRLDPVLPPPFPLDVGMDDNAQPGGVGGGPNASFVQEAGTNPLPGNPASPEVDRASRRRLLLRRGVHQGDSGGGSVLRWVEYEPVGTVLVNEYAAERAFAGSDNEKRYHFNLPATLKPTDQLLVSFDACNSG